MNTTVYIAASGLAGMLASIFFERMTWYQKKTPGQKADIVLIASVLIGLTILGLSFAGLDITAFLSPLGFEVGQPVAPGVVESLVNAILGFLAMLMASQAVHPIDKAHK